MIEGTASLTTATPTTSTTALRPIAVVPTYQNGRTVVDVVRRVLAGGWPCVVVDDGSTDATGDALDSLVSELAGEQESPALHVIRHASNRGKAAALAAGFERARALGFSHAVTLDADGQHDPEQIEALWACAAESPTHLVLGERPWRVEGGTPWRSSFGRRFSNTLVAWQSGVEVGDSQTGFRVYPLDALARLGCTFSRFAFETEVLIRAGRAGVPIATVPIRSRYLTGAGRVSHFAPLRDSMHSLWMHAVLLTGNGGLGRSVRGWLRHQLLFLPLFAFLIVGFSRSALDPEPRWHPAFLLGAACSVPALALWRRLRLGYQPLAAASMLFLWLGALGVLSRGTAFYPVIHHSYGQLRELALHLWVAAVCVLFAAFRPGWLHGAGAPSDTATRTDAWRLAVFAVGAVFLGLLLRPINAALAGAVPFVAVLL
ncbi:MAG: glycosyltransferase family 2 protein, partial [Planctomycetota bacterium]